MVGGLSGDPLSLRAVGVKGFKRGEVAFDPDPPPLDRLLKICATPSAENESVLLLAR